MSTSPSDRRPGRLVLRSGRPDDELTVVGPDLEHVAEGFGLIDTTIEPGLYEVVARAGPAIDRLRIRVSPGSLEEVALRPVSFPAPELVRGAAAATPSNLDLVERLTAGSAQGPADGAVLVIVIRRAAGESGGPRVDAQAVVDSRARLHAAIDSGWIDADDRTATAWAGSFEPGGYAIRTGRGELATDRAVWLLPGRQTIAFLEGDGRTGGASMSLHMRRLGEPWSANERDATSLALALWGLRQGRWQPVVPILDRRDLDGLAARDPILALAAAHLVLARPTVDGHVLGRLLAGLDRELPGLPDLDGLRLIAAGRGVDIPGGPSSHGWPPMFAAAYRALVRRDAERPVTLIDGSPAERVAARLVPNDVWTSWQPISERDHLPARVARTRVEPRKVIDKVARDPRKLRRSSATDPATRRVAAYLAAVADLEDGGDRRDRIGAVSPADIALATGLPATTVNRSLRRIWLTLGGVAVLPLVVTINVFLVAGLLLASLGVLTSGAPVFTFVPSPAPVTPSPAPVTSSPTPVTPSPVVTPPPRPVIESPAFLDLGVIGLGSFSERSIDLENVGDAPLVVESVSVDSVLDREFRIAGETCSEAPVLPGGSCALTVVFTPQAFGDRGGHITIEAGDLDGAVVELTGSGVGGLVFDPPELDFSYVASELELLVIGSGPVTITSVDVVGDEASKFGIANDDCRDRRIDDVVGCRVTVTYLEFGKSPGEAILRLLTEDGRPWDVPMSGEVLIFE